MGELTHYAGDVLCNRIKLDRREELKKKMRHRKAAAVATEINAKSDRAALAAGNSNSAITESKLRDIKYEVTNFSSSATDLDFTLVTTGSKLNVCLEYAGT